MNWKLLSPHALKPIFIFLASIVPLQAYASEFRGAEIRDNGKSLIISTADGKSTKANVVEEQGGFQNARVSPDGKFVGWLALAPNCCTSYPVPLSLVVMDQAQKIHTFTTGQAIFQWCFALESEAVAYMHTTLHGLSEVTYELRRISDGQLLSSYAYQDDENGNEAARKKIPAWAQCAAK